MKFKHTVLLIALVVGLASVVIQMFFNSLLPSFFYSFFFWYLLIFYYLCIWSFHLRSGFTLWTAFILFLFSALITSINLREVGEFFMRLSLICWIIGLIQSLKEYKKSKRDI